MLCKGSVIEPRDLPVEENNRDISIPPNVFGQTERKFELPPDSFSWASLGESVINQINTRNAEEINDNIFEQIEAVVLKAALDFTKQNKKAAANILGIYRPRLYGMLKKYKMD